MKPPLSWNNVREGSELLRVSQDGRFVIKRHAKLSPHKVYNYTYELTDLDRDKQEIVPTLQEARRLAEKWQ